MPDPTPLRQLLLEHYDAYRRDLPWRESREPYRVWVSEIMLQQTRVEMAIPYYVRWMERFPTVEDLAEADEQSVLKTWEGLGYYSRARNLHRSARIVRERLDGSLPRDSRGLRELPGIGEYTAGAIASIAFGEVVPAVDGNVRRVLSRLFDLEDPTDAMLRRRAGELVDPDRPGEWNQALMELGATVCSPRSPRCGACPVASQCRAMAAGTQEARPVPKRRPRVRKVSYAVLVALSPAGELLLVCRPSDGLLGGLWEFPAVEIGTGEAEHGDGDESTRPALRAVAEDVSVHLPSSRANWLFLPEVPHTFTHLKALYRPVLVIGVREAWGRAAGALDSGRAPDSRRPPDAGKPCERSERRWLEPEHIESLPLPAAQRKILDHTTATMGSAPTAVVGC